MTGLTRDGIGSARRIVVKVGSSSIAGENVGQIETLVDALAEAHERGAEVVLVSSGAIATGHARTFGWRNGPTTSPRSRPRPPSGRTSSSTATRSRCAGTASSPVRCCSPPATSSTRPPGCNAQRAMERLLGLRILPIVNENDTVATHEIRFGDNDRLAALVAELVGADLLVLLSDVDALYTKPPHLEGAERISHVPFGDELAGVQIGSVGRAGVGTGGAETKVSAARIAAASGAGVLITATALVREALRGEELGTWFEPAPEPAGPWALSSES